MKETFKQAAKTLLNLSLLFGPLLTRKAVMALPVKFIGKELETIEGGSDIKLQLNSAKQEKTNSICFMLVLFAFHNAGICPHSMLIRSMLI